jgi:preprotein translocase subunit SecY
MILFANIVVSFPRQMAYIFELIFNFDKTMPGANVTEKFNGDFWWIGTIIGVLGTVMILAMIAFMVFMTNSERRLPVQYAKRVVGRKMYGGQNTNLPLKLNMTGVMPIIFASSIVSIPATIAMFAQKTGATKGFWGWANNFNQYHWAYIMVFGILMIAFAYFYIAISFNPVEVANNLKKNGGSIPGIRTGRPTSDYISRILSRTTFIGAVCLLIIALLPMILGCIGFNAGANASGQATNWAYALTFFSFSGNSLLIVVGVVLETVREIEAQMTMRNFKGFLE